MHDETQRWIATDKTHCWHPFTRQSEWCDARHEPQVLVRGAGVWLWDSENRRYFDGNSSIWTIIHGHSHPRIVAAIQDQVARLSHVSFLGQTHPWAAQLAERLCRFFPPHSLERCFFSDNGSTAIECALKMAVQFRQQTAQAQKRRFVAFSNGYHGDTLGAASVGGVRRFFERFNSLGFPVTHVSGLEELQLLPTAEIAAVIIEPLIQGVNEIRPWPAGMLRKLRDWCDRNDVHLILDEVMTGFGRTGKMFACQHEDVVPDFLCLAKGITGGTLPLAATLTTETVYRAFLGNPENAFYYGHSYTANPLGCAAALASLDVFEAEQTLPNLGKKITHLEVALKSLKATHPIVHEIRQLGMIAGIELRHPDGRKFPADQRVGESICLAARAHGLLTRPILDTIVLMPPLSSSLEELDYAIAALSTTLAESRH